MNLGTSSLLLRVKSLLQVCDVPGHIVSIVTCMPALQVKQPSVKSLLQVGGLA